MAREAAAGAPGAGRVREVAAALGARAGRAGLAARRRVCALVCRDGHCAGLMRKRFWVWRGNWEGKFVEGEREGTRDGGRCDGGSGRAAGPEGAGGSPWRFYHWRVGPCAAGWRSSAPCPPKSGSMALSPPPLAQCTWGRYGSQATTTRTPQSQNRQWKRTAVLIILIIVTIHCLHGLGPLCVSSWSACRRTN